MRALDAYSRREDIHRVIVCTRRSYVCHCSRLRQARSANGWRPSFSCHISTGTGSKNGLRTLASAAGIADEADGDRMTGAAQQRSCDAESVVNQRCRSAALMASTLRLAKTTNLPLAAHCSLEVTCGSHQLSDTCPASD